ncbi:hypothetical protein DV735_g1108, partial [Chaetothyriales sp. CBS 134920]
MSGNFDSWEDAAAQDEQDLSSQAQNLRINANSFRPGANTFQPGAASFQPAYNQQPGQFLPRQGAPISIAKRNADPSSPATARTEAKPVVAAAASPAAAPAAATAPPKAKVISIEAKAEAKTEAKTEAPAKKAAEDGAKVTAAKAVEKSGVKVTSKTASPTASGKSSPAPGDAKKGQTSEAVAQDQTADVDQSVLEEMYGKEHVNIIFIGHVDAGKSTLGGQTLIQTGMVDERTLEKYKSDAKNAGRETWYISWVLDLNKEERLKGKTVEVGRGFFETEKRRYTILDAPGHKTYVPSMLSGASQADVAILVISARKGEFETGFEKGGQTQEHAMLIKTTGAKELLVVVNKMDDITVEWSKERYDEIVNKLKPFLKKRIGLDSTFLPLSAQTGLNVKDPLPKGIADWYKGPSMLQFLDGMAKIQRNFNAPFMMPVGAKYKDMGTMIEGRIEAGVLQKSSNYIMMPNKEEVGISALYGETEDEIPHATCGDQVRMRLRGIEEEDIMPGFVLCSPKRLVHCVSQFEAQISIVDLKSILSAGFNCVLHVHAATEEVTFDALLHKLEPKTGRKSKKPPPFAAKGQNIIARLKVTSGGGKVCVERFEDYPQLGRFTLRDQGQTIACAIVCSTFTAAAMDTYDAITQSTYQPSASRSSTPKPQAAADSSTEPVAAAAATTAEAQEATPKPEPGRQNLQTEFQETFKAFSNSPWGAKLGGWWSTTAKQGQSYYAEAVREAEDLRVDALKGLNDLKETLVEGVKTRARGLSASAGASGLATASEGDVSGEDGEGEVERSLQETETFLDKFKAEAAKRLKEVQAAEDAADVALLRFGANIRNFLKDAVVITAPGDSSDGGADGAYDQQRPGGNNILFESMDQSGRRVLHASRLDGQLYVIHTTPGQFIRDPDDDSNEAWIKWKQEFDVEKQTETIAKDLEKYPELRRTMEQVMKEQEVEYRDFWTRYYYLRMVVEEREEKRKALLKASADETEQPVRKHTATDSTATININNSKNGLLRPVEGRRSHDEKSVADSEASYDIVSGAPSRAASSPKQKRVDESDEEEDWE